jgi:Sulfate permease family
VEFTKQGIGERRESHGPLKLYIDDQVVAEQEIRTMTGMYALTGEGLCVGYDGGDAVSSAYTPSSSGPAARSTRSSTTSPTTPTSTSKPPGRGHRPRLARAGGGGRLAPALPARLAAGDLVAALTTWVLVVAGGIAVVALSDLTIIGYAESATVAESMANEHGYDVAPDRELRAVGIPNILSGLFQASSPAAGPASRPPTTGPAPAP